MLNVTGNSERAEELTVALPTLSFETQYTATITGTMANGTSFIDSVVFYTEICGTYKCHNMQTYTEKCTCDFEHSLIVPYRQLYYYAFIHCGTADVPSSPTDVSFRFLCPHHWLLSWGIPAVTNGELIHFEIEWTNLSSLSSDMQQVSVTGTRQMYQVELKRLLPGVEYSVRVRAYNHNGAGNFTDLLLIKPRMCGMYSIACEYILAHTHTN